MKQLNQELGATLRAKALLRSISQNAEQTKRLSPDEQRWLANRVLELQKEEGLNLTSFFGMLRHRSDYDES